MLAHCAVARDSTKGMCLSSASNTQHSAHGADPDAQMTRDRELALASRTGVADRVLDRRAHLGRPSRLPLALALSGPAHIRSRTMARSNRFEATRGFKDSCFGA
jgi:hypothetical protein